MDAARRCRSNPLNKKELALNILRPPPRMPLVWGTPCGALRRFVAGYTHDR
jgi:hypothetical protein